MGNWLLIGLIAVLMLMLVWNILGVLKIRKDLVRNRKDRMTQRYMKLSKEQQKEMAHAYLLHCSKIGTKEISYFEYVNRELIEKEVSNG